MSMTKSIPRGIRLLSYTTATRWFGWGISEAFFPVFFLSFANTFAETGLFSSLFSLSFLFVFPVMGAIADKIPPANLVIIGLLLYPFIGFSYFVAGATGMVAILVVARLVNGVGYSMDAAGRDTYFRQHSPPGQASKMFGYLDTFGNIFWVLAVVVGLLLIPYVPLHWLFLAIIPFHLLALVFATRVKHEPLRTAESHIKSFFHHARVANALRGLRSWSWQLKFVAAINFAVALAASGISFFAPIYSFIQEGNLQHVALIGIALAIPGILGLPLGKIAVKRELRAIVVGLLLFGVLAITLANAGSFPVQLGLVVAIGIVYELFALAGEGIITAITPSEHFGGVSGMLGSIQTMGSIAGPIIFGIISDSIGFSGSFIVAGILLLTTAIPIIVVGKKLLENPAVKSQLVK